MTRCGRKGCTGGGGRLRRAFQKRDSRAIPSGPSVAQQVDLPAARGFRAGVGQVDDHPLPFAVDRAMGLLDKTLQPLAKPVVAARLPLFAVHALLHHDPAPVVGDDEPVQVEIEAVLHRGAVDLGDQPARGRELRPVEADPLADLRSSCGVLRECAPRPPQTWRPSSPESGASPRFSAPITEVVIPDECQSMPMTAPNDWNQKGWASRRRNSSRPYSITMACVMTAPSRVIRSPSQRGTRPPWSGRSALPERRAVMGRARRRTGPPVRPNFAPQLGAR